MGGWGGQNVPAAIKFADILLISLNYTSPPSFIQIGPKLAKFLIQGGFGVIGVGGWGGLNIGWTLYVFLFSCFPPKSDFHDKFH